MKTDWQTKRLGDVCEIYQPKTISTKEMVLDGKYLVYGANGIIGKYNKYNHEDSQLLITCRGATCGNINISEPKSWINGNAMVVKTKDSNFIISDFLKYFFLGEDLSKIVTGSAQPQITRQTLSPLEISFPPLSEQKRIVKILDEAFEKLEKAKENTENNLQNSKELFESYLNNVFSNTGKNWERKYLGDFIKLEYGKPLPGLKRRQDGKYPVYGANGDRGRTNEFYFDKPSIIVGRKGTAGALNLTEEKFWPLDVTYFITFDNMKYDLKFIYYLLSVLNLPKLARGVKPGINRNEVYSIGVDIPSSLRDQKQIVKKLDQLSEKAKKLESLYRQKLESIEELRKSILQKAFNGEL